MRWIGPFPILNFTKTFLPQHADDGDYIKPLPLTLDLSTPGIAPKNDLISKLVEILTAKKGPFGGRFTVIGGPHDEDSCEDDERIPRPDLSIIENHIPSFPIDPGVSTFSYTLPFVITMHEDPFEDYFSEENLSDNSYLYQEKSLIVQRRLNRVLSEVFAMSCRTHTFGFLMNTYGVARLLRADRSGLIVSDAFNYHSEPEILWNFVADFSMLSNTDKGIDETVRLIDDPKLCKTVYERLTALEFEEWDSQDKYIFLELDILDVNGNHHGLITMSPGAGYEAMAWDSRGGMKLPVYDPVEEKVYFLKEGWRPEIYGIEREDQILSELRDAGVSHVPRFVMGGDLSGPNRATRSYEYESAEWRCKTSHDSCDGVIPRQHYRIMMEYINYRPLKEVKTAKGLVRVLLDALEAHGQAYEQCGILHRDISDANIVIIDVEGEERGVLVDWEFATHIGKESNKPKLRFPLLIGTWEFVSNRLLVKAFTRTAIQNKQDDFESFFWLLFYIGILYLPHNNPESDVEQLKTSLFYQTIWNPRYKGVAGGGSGKQLLLLTNYCITNPKPRFIFTGNGPFTDLFYKFLHEVRGHYFWFSANTKFQEHWGHKIGLDLESSKEKKSQGIVPNGLAFSDHKGIITMFEETLAADWSEEASLTDERGFVGVVPI